MRDFLTGTDQNISHWPVKMTFVEKVETAVRSDVESRFGVIPLSASDSILGLWFLTPGNW